MLAHPLHQFGKVPFSHGSLLPLLAAYQRPNDKIAEWLRQGILVSLKRGFYVLGPASGSGEVCLPLVANRLYGPSCISLDYALSWHGLIPERVYEMTSVCLPRGRHIDNDLGRFSYLKVPACVFPLGVQQEAVSADEVFLLASPAKALCDKVLLSRNLPATGSGSMQRFLLDDLRMDEDGLGRIDLAIVEDYLRAGHKRRQMQALFRVLEGLR